MGDEVAAIARRADTSTTSDRVGWLDPVVTAALCEAAELHADGHGLDAFDVLVEAAFDGLVLDEWRRALLEAAVETGVRHTVAARHGR